MAMTLLNEKTAYFFVSIRATHIDSLSLKLFYVEANEKTYKFSKSMSKILWDSPSFNILTHCVIVHLDWMCSNF